MSVSQNGNPEADASIASRSSVFSIAPGEPFLKRLALAICDGSLFPDFRPIDDPALLSDATIYLPTRRATRALAAEFATVLGSDGLLLPSIRTLGDGDDDEWFFQPPPLGMQVLPEAIGETERQLILAHLVESWTARLTDEARRLYADEAIAIPSSASDALSMADMLAKLIDQMQTEEIEPSKLAELADEDLGQWWQLTLPFLQIVLKNWPEILKPLNKVDPAEARGLVLEARRQALKARPPEGPVIAAGSTGSIPATARLLAEIAHLPKGAVVLPGLDRHLPETVWQWLAQGETVTALSARQTHPQYTLANLLIPLQTRPQDVVHLGDISGSLQSRERLISHALLPAEQTASWQELGEIDPSTLDNIDVIEASNERIEALAIAVALRETLEAPDKTAALVTPDRNLARRVARELSRFGVMVDDSAGVPMESTSAGRLLLAMTRALLPTLETGEGMKVIEFVSMAKHPYFKLGEAPDKTRNCALMFENAVLRGRILSLTPDTLADAVTDARRHWVRESHSPAAVNRMGETDWELLEQWAEKLSSLLMPLTDLAKPKPGAEIGSASLAEIATGLSQVLLEATHDEDGIAALSLHEDGEQVLALLAELSILADASLVIPLSQAPKAIAALMRGRTLRPRGPSHPRLHILGPLEARLQTFHRVVLGGLNEDSWPQVASNDPFLNRVMKNRLAMSAPEKGIGLSAHDFQMLMGIPEVILTRSERSDTVPSVASRWLQRLLTLAGENAAKAVRQRGNRYIGLAMGLDHPTGTPEAPKRAEARPPRYARPVKCSVSSVETWIRDPYAFYANKVLNLSPLEPLTHVPDYAMRGTLIHEVLAAYVNWRQEQRAIARALPTREQSIAHCLKLFDEEAKILQLPPEMQMTWRPRFEEAMARFIELDEPRMGDVTESLTEKSAALDLMDGKFRLTCRADRIDVHGDGTISILDYKTGATPSAKMALTLSPQLTLEGAIALGGGFSKLGKCTLKDLAYVSVKAGKDGKFLNLPGKPQKMKKEWIPKTTTEAAEWALAKLENLVSAYADETQAYISRVAPKSADALDGDYDHLARVREWSAGDDGDNDAAGEG